jgi:DNA-binding XRE family transcriptional regulator
VGTVLYNFRFSYESYTNWLSVRLLKKEESRMEVVGNDRRGPRRSRKTYGRLPNQIRRLRWQADLTIAELAQQVEVQQTHLGKAERTGKGLHRHSWYRLARFFSISPEELEQPDMNPDFLQ